MATELRPRYHYEVGTLQVYAGETTEEQQFSDAESSWSRKDHTLMTVMKLICQVDGAGNGLILSYADTHSFTIDGESMPPPFRSLAYMRKTPRGTIVESSDPDLRSALPFPPRTVSIGRPWTVTEVIQWEGCLERLSIPLRFTVVEEQGHRIAVEMTAPRLEFESDLIPGTRHSLASKGEYLFSLKSGCIVSSKVTTRVETRFADSVMKMKTCLSLSIQSASTEGRLLPPPVPPL